MSETQRFLQTWFGDKDDDQLINIWNLPNKRSTLFREINEISIEGIAIPGSDVFFGTCLSRKHIGPNERFKAGDIDCITGFWADIDIAHGVHGKANLPKTRRDAFKIIRRIRWRPTIIVHSGHGLQVYWRFKEPWVFENEADRNKAIDLSHRWGDYVLRCAQEFGFVVDSVWDLARVMRVPGTINNKANPVRTRLLYSRPHKNAVEPEDIDDFLPPSTTIAIQEIQENGRLILDANATPPQEKLEALMDNSSGFKKTWQRQRRDLTDTSASGYDLSLACFFAYAKWEDQEIANGLIAHRRQHGSDLKLRMDYYQSTISKARRLAHVDHSSEIIDAIERSEKTEEEKKEEYRKHIRATLGVLVKRIVKYMNENPEFHLEIDNGDIIHLGDVNNLIVENKLRSKIAALTGILIPKIGGVKWQALAAALLKICEESYMGDEHSGSGIMKSYILKYVRLTKLIDKSKATVDDDYPLIDGNDVLLIGSGFRRFINVTYRENMSAKQMGIYLKRYGCKADVITLKIGNKTTTRSVWRVKGGKELCQSSKDEVKR